MSIFVGTMCTKRDLQLKGIYSPKGIIKMALSGLVWVQTICKSDQQATK